MLEAIFVDDHHGNPETHVYQSFTRKCLRTMFVDDHHGDADMHMCKRFHLYLVRNSYREKCPWPFYVDGCHGNDEVKSFLFPCVLKFSSDKLKILCCCFLLLFAMETN